jgi:hypothetical protein
VRCKFFYDRRRLHASNIERVALRQTKPKDQLRRITIKHVAHKVLIVRNRRLAWSTVTSIGGRTSEAIRRCVHDAIVILDIQIANGRRDALKNAVVILARHKIGIHWYMRHKTTGRKTCVKAGGNS